jgi:hypothetical protein
MKYHVLTNMTILRLECEGVEIVTALASGVEIISLAS